MPLLGAPQRSHLHNAIKTMPVKTDRNDARAIAQLLRLGSLRPVHCKSMEARGAPCDPDRAQAHAKKTSLTSNSALRGIVRGFGLKVGNTRPARFAGRSRNWSPDIRSSRRWLSLVALRLAVQREFNRLEKQVRDMARTDSRALVDVYPGRRGRRAHPGQKHDAGQRAEGRDLIEAKRKQKQQASAAANVETLGRLLKRPRDMRPACKREAW